MGVVRISPLSRLSMAPTLSFTAKENGSSLEIAVISCADLPDKDLAGIGFGNKSDPYVKVKVSGYENQTKVADSLNPSYELKSSTFLFQVEDGDIIGTEVFFEVWDKDTFTKDDLLGKVMVLEEELSELLSPSTPRGLPGDDSRPCDRIGTHCTTTQQVIGRRPSETGKL